MPTGHPTGKVDPRSQSKRERFRKAVLAMHGPICWRCGRTIDLTLKHPHPRSYTADHVPELALLIERGLDPHDPKYGRPACRQCNVTAGASFGGKRLAAKRRQQRPRPPSHTEHWRNPHY